MFALASPVALGHLANVSSVRFTLKFPWLCKILRVYGLRQRERPTCLRNSNILNPPSSAASVHPYLWSLGVHRVILVLANATHFSHFQSPSFGSYLRVHRRRRKRIHHWWFSRLQWHQSLQLYCEKKSFHLQKLLKKFPQLKVIDAQFDNFVLTLVVKLMRSFERQGNYWEKSIHYSKRKAKQGFFQDVERFIMQRQNFHYNV